MEHIHFIGIGGTGLSAIAKVLLEQGYQVSGSDLTVSALFEGVKAAGGKVFQGHQAENIQGADLVIRSSAIPDDNPEILAAKTAGIPVLKRSEFLGRLMDGKNVIAIAGSHGKTTTTSMVSWILTALDRDPSYIVGGVITNLGTNAKAGKGNDFVIEADEYDHMFLGLNPDLAVITNVEHDHPDIFPTERSFEEAFKGFVNKLGSKGTLVLCGEDSGAMKLTSELKEEQNLVIYGFEENGREYIARDIQAMPGSGSEFSLSIHDGQESMKINISLQLPGKHNVLNAVAAFAVVDQLGLDRTDISRVLKDFKGSERRFESRGEFQGINLVDDYAHHPTEIKATLAAARLTYPGRRIVGVWQPHTYSRTQTLFLDFTDAFADADELIVLDVYAAREQKPVDFSITNLAAAIKSVKAKYIPGKNTVSEYLKGELQAGDVLLIFSAGDAIEINDELENYLSAQIRN
jgi:UDP-N-acetylmuramate--alanine ligase